jgi:FkbM family methyltransferase
MKTIKVFFQEIKYKLKYRYDFYYNGKAKKILSLLGIKVLSINANLFSQHQQDLIVYSILKNIFNFDIDKNAIPLKIVDIGANHPINFNNTYLFEKLFAAEIFSFEPNFKLKGNWDQLRPNSNIQFLGISDKEEILSLQIPTVQENSVHDVNMFASFDSTNLNILNKSYEEVKVKVAPLSGLLSFGEYDVLFIDVEGHELNVLKSIDFNLLNFKIIVIENNSKPGGDEKIRFFLRNIGYRIHSRIYNSDDVFIKM